MNQKKVQAHDTANLSVPSLEWIGLKLTDFSQFEFNKRKGNFLLKMNHHDKRLAKCLIEKLSPLFEFDIIRQVSDISYYLRIKK